MAVFILDTFGRFARPGLYSAAWGYVWDGRASQLWHAILFLNEIWFNHVLPGSDIPYWSLGFEVWYYIIFGVVMFAPRRWRVWSVLGLLLFVGPKITVLFPIWLLGLAAYRICSRNHLSVFWGALLCLGSLVMWGAYEVIAWRYGRPIWPNWIGRSRVMQDYIIGILFFFHLIGFRYISHVPGPLLRKLAKPIRWVAGATLTLYLFHMPLSQFLAAESPWASHSWERRVFIYIGVPILVFVIAEFTERRKTFWRRGFEGLFQRLSIAPS